MQLKPVDTFETISPEQFRKDYYLQGKPVIIKSLAQQWPFMLNLEREGIAL